jgi:uncharacterized protein
VISEGPVRDSPRGAIIDIRVIPRAHRTIIAGTRQDALLVRVAAPPVEEAANTALRRYLAQLLGLPVRSVRILAGEKSRVKRVQVDGLGADTVRARLGIA